MSTELPQLRSLQRYITTHDEKGEAVFSKQLPEPLSMNLLSADADIAQYNADLASPPGLVISTGSVCRIVDFPPAAESPMHRTVSLDYGLVLEGEVELCLDSGEKRVLKRGDIAIQRATNHAWRNVTPGGEYARMLYVLLPCQPVEVQGLGVLGEVTEGMDVKASE